MTGADRSKKSDLGRVATATVSTTSIVGIRLIVQSVVLILSARLLGVDEFGLVSAIVAVSLVLGPWGGLGYDFIALRSTSCDRTASSNHFWYGAGLIIKSAIPLVGVASAIVLYWSGQPAVTLAAVLILTAELVFLRATELVAKIFQGNDLFHEMAVTRLAISLARLLVLGVVAVAIGDVTAVVWGWANLVAAVLSLVVSLIFLKVRIGLVAFERNWQPPHLYEGLHFAAGITSVRISTEFDKSLVLGLAGVAGAGIYAASRRIVSLAVAPVISLINIVITSLFRLHGREDRIQLRNRSLAVCGVATAYGVVVGVFVWLLLPDIAAFALGEDFRALAAGLAPLSLLVIPTSLRLVGEQAVAALGRFPIRLTVQWIVAGISVALNLVAIPIYGWQGAAWVSLATETLLALSFLMIIATSVPRTSERPA